VNKDYQHQSQGSGGGKGRRGACAPGGTVQGTSYGRASIEFSNLAAFGELAFALQTVIFYTPNTHQFLEHPQLSVLHDPTQSSGYTKKLPLLI